MNNNSENSVDGMYATTPVEQSVIEWFWFVGIIVSSVCLLIQIALYVLIPKSRKIDEKILTQITVARLIYTSTEFLISKKVLTNSICKNIIYAMYMQSDMVLICWMFLFTKNLYDKVVLVFTLEKRNFIYISMAVWLLTLPLAAILPVLLSQERGVESNVLTYCHKVYTGLKFAVLLTNALFFCRIFYVVYSRRVTTNRNLKNILKTCIVSFILVCISSLQVLVTDILTSFGPDDMTLTDAFCVINSYQIVAVTAIFLTVVKSKIEGSLIKTLKINFKGLL